MNVPKKFERWHTDLIGPIRAQERKKYVIGAIDALIKYMIGGIIPPKEAKNDRMWRENI